MNLSEEKLTLRELYEMYFEQKTLVNDLPFQRNSGVWSVANKSNLVWSVMAGSFIPQIILHKEQKKGKGKKIVYHIADGLQRLTTLFSFINGEYNLHASTPEITVDGTIYDLANMGYSDLSEECQEALKNYAFNIVCVENCAYDELEHLFFSINSGVPLSTIQKSKPKLGTGLIGYLNELLQMKFFTHGINITEAQTKREDDLCLLLQNMLLLDDMLENIGYKSISTAVCLEYAESIRNTYSDKKKERLRKQIEYLSEAFEQRHKFLRKTNAPIAMVCAYIAQEYGVRSGDFRSFINTFANACIEEYDEACGSGNVKATKVRTRLRVMFTEMCRYFEIPPDELRLPFDGCEVECAWLLSRPKDSESDWIGEPVDDDTEGEDSEEIGFTDEAPAPYSAEVDEATQDAITSLREQYGIGTEESVGESDEQHEIQSGVDSDAGTPVESDAPEVTIEENSEVETAVSSSDEAVADTEDSKEGSDEFSA